MAWSWPGCRRPPRPIDDLPFAPSRLSTPTSIRPRTISSMNSGLPPARSRMRSRRSPAERAPTLGRTARQAGARPRLASSGARRSAVWLTRFEVELVALGPGRWVTTQHQPRALQPVHHETQRLQRDRVGPMQVLDNDQQRRLRQSPFEDGADRVENLPAQLLRLDVAQGCRRDRRGRAHGRAAASAARPRRASRPSSVEQRGELRSAVRRPTSPCVMPQALRTTAASAP